jgi:hypothetical protein
VLWPSGEAIWRGAAFGPPHQRVAQFLHPGCPAERGRAAGGRGGHGGGSYAACRNAGPGWQRHRSRGGD